MFLSGRRAPTVALAACDLMVVELAAATLAQDIGLVLDVLHEAPGKPVLLLARGLGAPTMEEAARTLPGLPIVPVGEDLAAVPAAVGAALAAALDHRRASLKVTAANRSQAA